MKALVTLFAGLMIAAGLATRADAQVYVHPASFGYGTAAYVRPGLLPVYPRPRPYYYYAGYHASTAAEGYMRGVASVISAQGQYNVMTAQAAVLAQEARKANIENHRLAVETTFAARKINHESRALERGPRASAEEIARLAKAGAPPRLTDQELNQASGRIAWPAALMGDEFAAFRAEIEGLFAKRRASGGLGADERERIELATGAMMGLLKGQITDLPAMQYTKARRFIESLGYEAQLPTT